MGNFDQDYMPNMCTNKFGLEATEQHSELTAPRRNIFAQTNYDDVDFFTKQPSCELFEEKSDVLERASLSLTGKYKEIGLNELIHGEKSNRNSDDLTNLGSSDESQEQNVGSDWLQSSPSLSLSLQKQSSGGSICYDNNTMAVTSLIPENLDINLDALIQSPTIGSPRLGSKGANNQSLEDSYSNLSSSNIQKNDVPGCTVIQNVREVSTPLAEQEKPAFFDVSLSQDDEESSYENSSYFKISREGRRKDFKKKNSVKNNRRRKTDEQVSVLVKIFDKYDGKLSKEMKNEAINKTGLAWIQIYKWFFDHKVKKSNLEKAYRLHYPFQVFKVVGADGRDLSRPQPIFKVEKILPAVRNQHTSGNPLL